MYHLPPHLTASCVSVPSSCPTRAPSLPPSISPALPLSAMNTINLLSDARFFDDSNTRLHQLRTQLDSKSTKDKLDAMKSLIAHMTLGRDMSAFFPDVVKNVVVESQEVKKLVYMFLITYSEHNQDLALLSINTFQKDLASPFTTHPRQRYESHVGHPHTGGHPAGHARAQVGRQGQLHLRQACRSLCHT